MNRNLNLSKTVIFICVLLWVVSIIAIYYLVHKPLSPFQAINLGIVLGQFIVSTALISLGAGLGRWLLPEIDLHPLIRLVLQAVFGLGLLGIGFLLVGSAVGVNSALMWGILLFLVGIFWKYILKWWLSFKLLMSSLLFDLRSRLEISIALGVGVLLISTLVITLAPPTQFDTLVYHLSLPKIYLETGRIVYVPWLFYWGMPQITEMLFTWAYALAGKESAIILGWLIGLLALVGLFGYVNQYFGKKPAWVAVAALLAGSTTAEALAWGYVDWASILFGWAFLVALQSWVSNSRRQYLTLAGIFAGLALGVKYTNGILLLIGILVIVSTSWGKSLRTIMLDLSYFGGICFIMALPWFLKNLWATGNPIYPFFFPAGEVNLIRLNKYQNRLPWGNWLDLFFLPLRATIYGAEGAPGYDASIGPLLLALGALARLKLKHCITEQRAMLRTIYVITILGLILWAIAARFSEFLIQSRLYFCLFPAFSVLAGVGFDVIGDIKVPRIRLQRVVGTLILLVLFFNVFDVSVTSLEQGAPQNILSIQSDHDYLVNNLGWYAVAMKSINDLPSDARVLMLWEPRSFYCISKCLPDETFDIWYNDFSQRQSWKEVLQFWRNSGYTHLLLNHFGAEYMRSEYIRRENNIYHSRDWQALELLLSNLTHIEDFGDVYILYSLDGS